MNLSILTSNRLIKYCQDLTFFYNFLPRILNFLIFKKNWLMWFKLHNLFTNYFNLKTKLLNNFMYLNNTGGKTRSFMDSLKIEKKFQTLDIFLTQQTTLISDKFSDKNWKFSFKKIFFSFNFLFAFTSFDPFFKHNHLYHFFHFKNYKKNLITVSIRKFLNRWKDAQNLIFNIFYYKFLPLVFGSFDFKNEILALNWNNLKFEINFWKYSFSFFVFKTNRYGLKINHFYNKLILADVNFLFISNPLYHYKNLYYFNKLKFFSIGPVGSNISPWTLSYPLPAVSISSLIEYFFLKFLVLLEKNATYFKYIFIKNNWILFFLFTKLNSSSSLCKLPYNRI